MILRRYNKTRVGEEPKKAQKPKKVREPKKVEVPAYDDVVKADIRDLLDDKGIEYNERDNKTVLYELLVGSD